jgi:hypothetical protein
MVVPIRTFDYLIVWQNINDATSDREHLLSHRGIQLRYVIDIDTNEQQAQFVH